MPDTMNKYMVGSSASGVYVMAPLPQWFKKADALNLAAWLVAIADDNDEFPELLEAIKNT